MHSLSIVRFWNLKKWIGQLVRFLKNSRIHIKFHSKLFIGTENELKNEMIKLSVKSFVKP
jgi:hypothetical protein